MSSSANLTSRAHKRSVKNYLIDSRFQLKYTGFIVGVALVISGILVAFLWKTSRDVVAESQKVLEESKTVVAESHKALEESRKVSQVVQMSIKNDPFYKDNPELLKAFDEAASDSDKKFQEQQDAIVKQQQALAPQQAALVAQQNTIICTLIGGLALMVLLIGLAGIYFTHKVAGPIFKMKRLLKKVGDGQLNVDARLRKGDELREFFETFSTMVASLRARQAQEVEDLDMAINMARVGGATEESLVKLLGVRDQMKHALEV
jgi:nitrogen fixation/metabolism regulation signal transduction histidine kinase